MSCVPKRVSHLRITIISDSMCRDISIKGVVTQAFSGATLQSLTEKVLSGEAKVAGYDLVLFHIATNDIQPRNPRAKRPIRHLVDMVIDLLDAAVDQCYALNSPVPHLYMVSVLPRPKDEYAPTGIWKRRVRDFNEELRRLMGNQFIDVSVRFKYHSQAKTDLFVMKPSDRLHLSYEGKKLYAESLMKFFMHFPDKFIRPKP